MVCSAGSRPQWPNGLSDQGQTSRQQAAASTVGAEGWAPARHRRGMRPCGRPFRWSGPGRHCVRPPAAEL